MTQSSIKNSSRMTTTRESAVFSSKNVNLVYDNRPEEKVS